MSATAKVKLNSINWDFANSVTPSGVHSIHPYPARFIPHIPRTLIEMFHPGDSSKVLDPFCGSGTTLVEAMSVGITSVGVDLSPLAALIAKVKTTPLSSTLMEVGEGVSQAAQERVANNSIAIPAIPRLEHWFQRPIQEALASLVAEINTTAHADLADALKVAVSSIIVRVSNQDSDTRYAAIEKKVTQKDVWLQFERAVSNIAVALTNVKLNFFHPPPTVRVITADLMEVQPNQIGQDIGLVVTSPPYPNAYEYWLYHKYRMYWLGMDPITVRSKEIGARAHFFKKNHQTEFDFECQMARCFSLLSQVMLPGAHACFVVGRSIIHGRYIDNEVLLERAAGSSGFKKVGSITRKIAVNRKSFNPSHGKINEEGIVVFALEGK